MGKIENQLKKITEKCKILYKEQCISTPPLLQAYIRYLSLSFRKDEHNVGIVLHTNSICFDILSITFSAIINLIVGSIAGIYTIASLKARDAIIMICVSVALTLISGLIPAKAAA